MIQGFTNVSERLNSRFTELGLKQLDVCAKTGLSTTAMSQYCTGKRIPETAALYKIASVLNVSMEWILLGRDIINEDLTTEDAYNIKLVTERQSLTCDGSPLKDDEADLVAMYRLLPDHQQEDVFDFTEMKYRKHVERKKESIYWTYKEDRAAQKSGPAEDDDVRDGTA